MDNQDQTFKTTQRLLARIAELEYQVAQCQVQNEELQSKLEEQKAKTKK